MTDARPTDATREHVIDRLRGFALLGVLLVNTPFLMTSVEGITLASMPHWVDRAAAVLTWTLFQAKSYVVFSFLFGYSLTLLLASVERRGFDATRVYRQRLLALSLIGAVHAACFFVGDILVVYAMLGTMLLWLRHKPDRTVLRVAGVLFAVQVVVFAALAFLPEQEPTTSLAWVDRSWANDGFLEATVTRLRVWPLALAFVLALQGPLVGAMFCLGLVAGRRQWLADIDRHRALFLRLRSWGFLVGLPIHLWCGIVGTSETSATQPLVQLLCVAVLYLTAPILSAAFVAAIVLLPRRGFAKLVETDGRMSLSIYLGESIVMTSLAAGWGAQFFGQRTGAAFLIALVVWTILLLAASLWDRHVGMGPAERALRRLTYWGTASERGARHASERAHLHPTRPRSLMRAALCLAAFAIGCGTPSAGSPSVASDSATTAAPLTSGDVIVFGAASPVDDATRHVEFAAFRDSLIGIVARRDTLALFALLTPEVKLSHGGDQGREGLRTVWEYDQPTTRLWTVLDDVLHHGAVLWSDSQFVAPYTNQALPDSLDPFEHLIVRDSNVMVYAVPDASTAPIARLDYAIVRAGETHDDPSWRTVRLSDGRSAYVRDEHIRSPIDHRIYFERIAGRWMITIFLAGD